MRFKFAGFFVNVKKIKNAENKISKEDLEGLNGEITRRLRSETDVRLTARCDEVFMDKFDEKKAKSCLKDTGICIARDFINENVVDDVNLAIKDIVSKCVKFDLSDKDFVEEESYLMQKGGAKVSGYAALASYGKPVIQIRQGADQGMVDIFNADKLVPSIEKNIRNIFEQEDVKKALGKKGMEAKNLNIYINRGVEKTRGFHVDSYGEQIKGFVYLTDVLRLEDGPYTYVKKSHKKNLYRKINKLISEQYENETEAPIVPYEDVMPVLAPKGSLIISDQGGVHRGFPQSSEGERIVVVMNYK
ncbi:phytanoyl-CoA dioxygenase family protein [Kushneria indalinina]|uniref:Phytanoyl-CoA dioxygenase PhyH n=1 Tax=Kushneria indalinina DSM 14324 TaxID=1122140 RepID=A0A3D9DV64_9GAMM|nr:phytanoyl-CoA dioxygenase family protein [Kushneria indalinina]REC94279.1 phytanoyl-CoA dioxygenase PhyH [Kushneria indalinina DSM 14324]